MVKIVPDAGFCVPVTVLIDERPDGVHLSYDHDNWIPLWLEQLCGSQSCS
jgi:hypothetical protein